MFAFGPWPTIKFQYWLSKGKSVGTPGLTSTAKKCLSIVLFLPNQLPAFDIICHRKVVKLCAWMSFALLWTKAFFFSYMTKWCINCVSFVTGAFVKPAHVHLHKHYNDKKSCLSCSALYSVQHRAHHSFSQIKCQVHCPCLLPIPRCAHGKEEKKWERKKRGRWQKIQIRVCVWDMRCEN